MPYAPHIQEGLYVLTASRRLGITTVGIINIQFISVNVKITCTSKRKGLGIRRSVSQEDSWIFDKLIDGFCAE